MGKRAAVNTNRLTVACDDKMAQKVYDAADFWGISTSKALRTIIEVGLKKLNAARR